MAVLDQFSDIVVSGDEQLAKPDPRIFNLAADRFGYAPEAMLFIDDNAANIAAAARSSAGRHTISRTRRASLTISRPAPLSDHLLQRASASASSASPAIVNCVTVPAFR